jgi:hypothetical protein
MLNKKRFYRVADFLSPLLVLLIMGGCSGFFSGTFVITFEIYDEDINIKDEVGYFQVDLTGEDIWEKHKDDINNIDLVGFEIYITNNAEYEQTISLHVTDYDDTLHNTAGGVDSNTTRVVHDLDVAAGVGTTTHIDWATSVTHLENINVLKKYVEGGRFTTFILPDPTPYTITVDSARVIVTVTATVI